MMKSVLTVTIFAVALAQADAGDELFNITFSQFSAGSEYTNASGAPSDFSAYNQGYADYAQVVTNFSGLTDQPLLSMTTGVSSRSIYTLDAPGYSNHVLTLSLELALEALPPDFNGPSATIGFYSDTGIGAEETAVEVLFGWSRTNGGSLWYTHTEVISREGPTYLPTYLFATSASFARNTPATLDLSVNTRLNEFSATVNGTSLVHAAPFGSTQEIVRADIALGNFYPPYGAGAGIDNIRLQAISAIQPYFYSLTRVASDLSIGISNLVVGSTNYLLQSPSLVSPAWATATSFEATTSGTNWTGPLSQSNTFYQLRSEQ